VTGVISFVYNLGNKFSISKNHHQNLSTDRQKSLFKISNLLNLTPSVSQNVTINHSPKRSMTTFRKPALKMSKKRWDAFLVTGKDFNTNKSKSRSHIYNKNRANI